MRSSRGVTLTEMIVAVAVISIAVIGLIGAFQGIAVSVQHAKMRTLATNLAQEKMQILRQVSYYRLLITTSSAYNTDFSPPVQYDTGYYPPEAMFEGGTTFTRLTHVQMASEVSGVLTPLGPTMDTGMKMITVTVLWSQGAQQRKLSVQSIVSNPNTTMATAVYKGRVTASGSGTAVPSASVTLAENMGWQDSTDSNGDYVVTLYPGNYSVIVSARGFFTQTASLSIAANQTVTQNFSLMPQSSGTVSGTAWINNHAVISQVVASTESAAGIEQEYIELYNPTTSFIQVSQAGAPQMFVFYVGESPAAPLMLNLSYVDPNGGIAPAGYYLIANTTTVQAAGATRQADAVYTTPGADIIKSPDAGGIGIMRSGVFTWEDCVGWDRNNGGKTAPIFEDEGIDQGVGFTAGEQYVRRCSTAGYAAGLGRCYDSGNNDDDFLDYATMQYPPRSSADTEPAVAGTPAIGAVVSCNDDLSFPKTATSYGDPPCAQFQLTEVATGTWTVMVTSGIYTLELTTVTIAAHGQVLGVPNAATGPTWPATGWNACLLTNVADTGFISGRVTNAAGTGISPGIKVSAGGVQVTADTSSGKYIVPVVSGTYSVTANPANTNAQYVSQTLDDIAVQVGQITSNVDFTLSRGGIIKAWVTRDGINPIPGVSVVALDAYGAARAQDVSRTDGSILLLNLSTGTYTVQPVLDSGEISSPTLSSTTVSAGTTVFASSFTITGAFGTIRGAVTRSGQPISTGVLVVASTSTIATPPTLNAAMAATSSIYTTNSYEDGTYALSVRGSSVTTYKVYAYYPVASGSSYVIWTGTVTNVSVNQGQTVTGVNFPW